MMEAEKFTPYFTGDGGRRDGKIFLVLFIAHLNPVTLCQFCLNF